MKFAIVFPGQGSQTIGMLNQHVQSFPLIKQVFSKASDALGYDLWALVQGGPAEKLNQTEFTQPAMLAADIALWECWRSQYDLEPSFVAGHSLGEYAALVVSGVIAFNDAIKLVQKRGAYMQQALPSGQGAMAAIIGLEDKVVETICQRAAQQQIVSAANFNSTGQVVIAGHLPAVERAIELAKNEGAKLAKLIPVSVPSHCSLMQLAAEQLQQDLNQVYFSTPNVPIVQNVDAVAHNELEVLRQNLIAQLTMPVRWVQTINYFADHNALTVFECGPGKVLQGLNKRINPSVNTFSFDVASDLQGHLQAMKEKMTCH